MSDLIWLDDHPYDAATGKGSIGVEFAGTAVTSQSPAGQNISLARANNASRALVASNRELQWSELYYRGYYELRVGHDKAVAEFFGMPTVVNRNPNEISLANFTILSGANALQRPFQTVENGALKGGQTLQTNLTKDTATGKFFISMEEQEDL